MCRYCKRLTIQGKPVRENCAECLLGNFRNARPGTGLPYKFGRKVKLLPSDGKPLPKRAPENKILAPVRATRDRSQANPRLSREPRGIGSLETSKSTRVRESLTLGTNEKGEYNIPFNGHGVKGAIQTVERKWDENVADEQARERISRHVSDARINAIDTRESEYGHARRLARG